MKPFETYEDLLAGWPDHPNVGKEAAETMLLRASAYVASEMRHAGIEVDAEDEDQALALLIVTCNVTRRAMRPGGMEGIASMSQAIGTTNASVQMSNPDGALFLNKSDKTLLGIVGRSKYRAILAHANGDDEGGGWS